MNQNLERRRPLVRATALAVPAVVAALLAGCDTGSLPPPRSEIEQFIGTTLPPNIGDLRVAGETGIDRLMLLRFDAPAGEAVPFVARLLPDGLKAGADPGLRALGTELDWWVDTMPPGAEGGERTAASNRTIKLVSAPVASGIHRIWLAVFTR